MLRVRDVPVTPDAEGPIRGDGAALEHDRQLHGTSDLTGRLLNRLNASLERRLPEQRLFLKSGEGTRFVRLRPLTQAVAIGGSALVVGWAIVATAILFIDAVVSGNARNQALRGQEIYEARLDALSAERDKRAAEALAAQERFAVALRQVSAMQSALLASEERRKELETGLGVVQATLRRTMNERDAARAEAEGMRLAAAGEPGGARPDAGHASDLTATVDFLTSALARTSGERDAMAGAVVTAEQHLDDLAYEMRLQTERNNQIFERLEEAVAVSMEPLDKMFSAAGLDPDELIDQVRSGYSGIGGPGALLPAGISTKGADPAATDPSAARAQAILDGFDRLNMYRIAAEKAPFALPLKSAFRFTSGFGRRWGRLHAGTDFAGAYGSPIYATADGVVVHAGWESGYGRLVEIRHDFGLRTRYAHLSDIDVKVGQRVSRGDHIGDMGNSGNSTGTHLHYEVRVGDTPVNPMTYIKAANNVF